MATVYAIANQKGGVGKTTTAVNLAACLAEAGHPTLLIDLDAQANATVALGHDKNDEPSIYDVIRGDTSAVDAVASTSIESLALLSAHPDLAASTIELARTENSEGLLREALAPVLDKFEFAVIDCPPALGPLTINALVASDRVIIPVQAEYFALEGLAGLLETLRLVQRGLNPRLVVSGMLLTMYDSRTRLALDVEAEVRQHFPDLVFKTVIPRNVRVSESPSYGVPVTHHDPHSSGASAYFDLAQEVVVRG